jgi:hypothetical protein
MTDQAKWLASESPASLLYNAQRLKMLDHRKSLLFACGCYRLIWDKICLPTIREVVEKAEERADRKLSQRELSQYRYPDGDPAHGTIDWYLLLSAPSLVTPKVIPTHITWLIRAALEPEKHEDCNKWERCKPQADLVREIFGNPFHPVSFNPSWRTTDAVGVARSMYDARDFAAMPILADALEDAGCDSADVLAHCRGDGPHVRGCWVVDLVLGKA